MLRLAALIACVILGLALGRVADASADTPDLPSAQPAAASLSPALAVALSSVASLADRTWLAWDPADWSQARGTAVPRIWSYVETDPTIAARGSMSQAATQDISINRTWATRQWAIVTNPSIPAVVRGWQATGICVLVTHEVGHRWFGHTDEADGAATNAGKPWAQLMAHSVDGDAPGCDAWGVAIAASYTPCSRRGMAAQICRKARHVVTPNKKNMRVHVPTNWRAQR